MGKVLLDGSLTVALGASASLDSAMDSIWILVIWTWICAEVFGRSSSSLGGEFTSIPVHL